MSANGPDKVLVINSGSSSLKFRLFSMESESVLAKGIVERIGSPDASRTYQREGGEKMTADVQADDHGQALNHVTTMLTHPEHGVLESLTEVEAIGHRVLHGGEEFSEPVLVNTAVKDAIRRYFDLGPLHNPANLQGIEACEKMIPGVPNVAVFDTAFHKTMPRHAYLYAIPLELYEKYHIRKYGFHGTSHKFVTEAAAAYLKKPLDQLTIITCHLGNGSSLAAIKNGKVYDTTMGLTPLQGLIMGTRSGGIDPAVVFYLANKGYTIPELDRMLNKESGLLAISGTGTGDMRDLVAAAESGQPDAVNAFAMFAHRTALYIGGYYTLLGGVDAIIFTGGIGENSHPARQAIANNLRALGVELDDEKNKATFGTLGTISREGSRTPVIVIPTNEELMIARETFRLVSAG
ncbi:MAG: acetate kinase [Lentisphaerae bacterium]|nr:acetate kinase [Lentisphaerota bacterium]